MGHNITIAPEEPWEWPFDGDEERYPTIAHAWANVQVSSIAAMGRYKAYISELDMLTYNQVIIKSLAIITVFLLCMS